jgi:hypothetical protein
MQRLLSEPVPGISAAPSEDNLVSHCTAGGRRGQAPPASLAQQAACYVYWQRVPGMPIMSSSTTASAV